MSLVRQRICLIIEDDTEIAEMLSDALSDLPLSLKVAASAEKGIGEIKNMIIDVAIVDIFMPGRGGIWAIEAIRKRNPEAEIIAISGGWQEQMPSEKVVQATEKIGVRHSFEKPFDVLELRALVEEICFADDKDRAKTDD